MSTPDLETRQRLIQAAASLFADHGFDAVTVRQICTAARANVAAVNYHFGDKAGLYRMVVDTAIATMRETNELSQRAGDGATPEAQIRAFVLTFMRRLTGRGRHTWIHKLMAREVERPGESLDQVVREVIQPRLDYLAAAAGAVMHLPPADPRVVRAVASLHGQCLMFVRKVPAPIASIWGEATGDVEVLAAHIADFSLGGMRAVAAATSRRDQRPAKAKKPA